MEVISLLGPTGPRLRQREGYHRLLRFHTYRGYLVAAVFYSLLETAKLNDVEPRAYLLEAARRAVRASRIVFLPSAMAN